MRSSAGKLDLRGVPDTGSAIVEFIFLGVLLMVPLAYLMLTVFRVQAATYAVSSAAREAGRAFVTATSEGAAIERAQAAAQLALTNYGLKMRPLQLDISCSADPCLTPGAPVRVRLTEAVRLPLVPDFFGRDHAGSVRVTGEHVAVVDRFKPTLPP